MLYTHFTVRQFNFSFFNLYIFYLPFISFPDARKFSFSFCYFLDRTVTVLPRCTIGLCLNRIKTLPQDFPSSCGIDEQKTNRISFDRLTVKVESAHQIAPYYYDSAVIRDANNGGLRFNESNFIIHFCNSQKSE